MKNAVTILSFPDGKLRADKYFRNVVDDIWGSRKGNGFKLIDNRF